MVTSLVARSVLTVLLSVLLVVLIIGTAELYTERFEFKSNPLHIDSEKVSQHRDLFHKGLGEMLYREEGLELLRLHREYIKSRSSIFRMLRDGNTHFFHYEELLRRSRPVIWIPCLLIGFLFPGHYSGWRYWVSMIVPVACVATGIFVISYLWFVMLFTYLGSAASRSVARVRSPR